MSGAKVKDYRGMNDDARTAELANLLREQFNLRMQKATAQLANTSTIRKVRRNIARLRTVMNQVKVPAPTPVQTPAQTRNKTS